jgi:uncharacterized protein YciI
MYVVLLTFSDNKGDAGKHMQDHKDWLQAGFDDGIFLMAGSLQPNRGGAILVHNVTRADLAARVKSDPFVAANVVGAEILEIAPSRADPRLNFLLG